MINILSIVSYKFLPAHMGGERGIACFYEFFARHVNLVCVTTRKNDPHAVTGYEVLNILSDKPLRYGNIFYFFTLRKIIRQKKITHILLEHPYYGWLGVLLKVFCGLKLIVHSHNIEGLRWRSLGKWWWKILWYYEGWTHRKADYNFFKQPENRTYAVQNFRLLPGKCMVVDYGVARSDSPTANEKKSARERLCAIHGIPEQNRILLFNGAFRYMPNLNGLERIVNHIAPELVRLADFPYTIIICGKNIPATCNNEKYPEFIFAGFVDDINLYFTGADIFLNPVIEGGGIKTKIVEAIAGGNTVVSTVSGAAGMNTEVCGNKLIITADYDWQEFAQKIVEAAKIQASVPRAFYEHYYWGNISAKAARFIANSSKN